MTKVGAEWLGPKWRTIEEQLTPLATRPSSLQWNMPLKRPSLAIFAATGILVVAATSSYDRSIQAWRQQREAELKAPGGWLSVAGLFWLKPGENRCGADPSFEVALPAGSAPKLAGTFDVASGVVTFRANDPAVLLNGKPAGTSQLTSDRDRLKIGDLTLFVIRRADRYYVRLIDPNSQMLRDFKGLEWYPIREEYRVVAKFTAYDQPRKIAITNVLGITQEEPSPGYATFDLMGHPYRLEAVIDEKQLFFIFRDQTSGKTTYGAGRFLHAEMPKEGKTVLDFNKAYNPPCAFTAYATCPLPPKQNRLPVKIEAGELNYGHH